MKSLSKLIKGGETAAAAEFARLADAGPRQGGLSPEEERAASLSKRIGLSPPLTVPLDEGTAAELDELHNRVRRRAEEIGFEEGFRKGQEQGKMQAAERLKAELAEIQQELEQLTQAILEQRKQLLHEAEWEICELALDVARRVVKDEVRFNRNVVANIAKEAIRRVVDKESVRIRVNLEDVPQVRAIREELLMLVDGIKHLEIVDDRRVPIGGVTVETASGTIDSRLETQFDEISRAMREAFTE
jgi:flagellar assembly protein FliH